MSCPRSLCLELRDRFGIETFVETGTYLADTALWASDQFKNVYSIERSPIFYAAARDRFKTRSNITFLNGDAGERIGEIPSLSSAPAIFWLDAHWSGNDTAGEGDECPLAEELSHINAVEIEHFILIDDARLFLAPPPAPHRPEQWPTIEELMSLLNPEGKRRHVIVKNDVVIAVPPPAKDVLVEHARSRPDDGRAQPFVDSAQRALSRLRFSLWAARQKNAR